MDQQIKGKDSVANYSKVVYHTEPNPTLINMIVKSGTSMALKTFFMSLHFHFLLVLTDLPLTTAIASLTSGHFLNLSASI